MIVFMQARLLLQQNRSPRGLDRRHCGAVRLGACCLWLGKLVDTDEDGWTRLVPGPFAICSSLFVVFMIIRTRTGNGMVWKARPRQDDGFVDVSSIGS
mgnify:CR=1 FL=1|jgi:hypothetical protein